MEKSIDQADLDLNSKDHMCPRCEKELQKLLDDTKKLRLELCDYINVLTSI